MSSDSRTPSATVTLPSASAPGKPNLMGMSRGQLQDFFQGLGEPAYRATQLLKWIHQHRVMDFDAMTNLSKRLRGRLQDLAEIRPPQVASERCSRDGTRKWLLRVDASNAIEMVYIPDGQRGTLCVSSQAGCALNCTFCATAQQGYSRNLTAAEIIGQLWLAHALLGADAAGAAVITNVVLMGMGEPLLNFDNVVSAVELMLEDCAYGMARRRVTLSTAGVVPAIDRLKAECPVSLAVSLHAPNDDLRDRLVPLNRSYPTAELIRACRDYVAGEPREKVTFEYVLLDGVNDSPEQARELVRLLANLPAKVNLIPFNPFPDTRFRRSPPAVVDRFRGVLLEHGIMTITRKTRGDDIDAACGQLAGRVKARNEGLRRRRAADAMAAAG